MNLSLTNTGNITVPIIAGEWADVLPTNAPFTFDRADLVAVIGDKPGVRDQFERAFDVLSDTAKALLEAFQNRTRPDMPTDDTLMVTVMIHNLGTNAVRVILGDGVTDATVAPGTTYAGTGRGYLELRELGHVNPNIERQPSSAA
jgi:hypothetical protein